LLHCCCRYVTFAIGVAAEVFALILVGSAVDRLGRHNIVACGQLLGGGACLACALVKRGTAQAVLAGVGKLGSSGGPRIVQNLNISDTPLLLVCQLLAH